MLLHKPKQLKYCISPEYRQYSSHTSQTELNERPSMGTLWELITDIIHCNVTTEWDATNKHLIASYMTMKSQLAPDAATWSDCQNFEKPIM